jgi:hypothetical protein
MASALVAKSAEIQAGCSKCDDDGKRKIAMKCHTSMRTFDVGAFFDGDEEKSTAYMNGGLVFGVAKAAKLWSDGQFLFSHIENKLMFQESQPYHSQQLNLGMRFEIYLQAFRVIDKANFLQEAKAVLYLAMKKKNEAGWNSVEAMFAAFLEGGSSYYVGRSKKGGFWRYWNTLLVGAARDQSEGCIWLCKAGSSRYYASACGQKGSRTQVSGSLEGKRGTGSICI